MAEKDSCGSAVAEHTEALLASPALLQKLEAIVEKQIKRKLCERERQDLEGTIRAVAGLYYVAGPGLAKFFSWFDSFRGFHGSLAQIIAKLEQEPEWAVHCLKDPLGSHRLDEQTAKLQYANILVGLRKIARRVPAPASAKRDRGKPPKSGDFEKIVELLAIYWKQTTGKPITRNWYRHEPANAAMRFIHTAIGFIDADRLNELPHVTRTIVEAQRDRAL